MREGFRDPCAELSSNTAALANQCPYSSDESGAGLFSLVSYAEVQSNSVSTAMSSSAMQAFLASITVGINLQKGWVCLESLSSVMKNFCFLGFGVNLLA